jgi:iron(III) transport system permease protein
MRDTPKPYRRGLRSMGVVLTALVVAFPVISVFSFVLHPAGEVWRHLVDTVLRDYIVNSLVLMVGVTVGTLLMGVATAWLVTVCRFPGRRLFNWALLLPLAIPAYIIAYTYTGMLDFAGPVQTALREWFGWASGDYWFPEIRSRGGAIAMLSLVLYPYVYLLARAAFMEQSANTLDTSRTLGCSPWGSFFRVSLPAARPAIVAGLSLALMETLADYGTVQYFGVSTFTTGIFRTWFGLGDSAAAAQLAALLLGFVFVLIVVERHSRRRARYHNLGGESKPLTGYTLRGARAWMAVCVCAFPLLLGFVLPTGQLLVWSVQTAHVMVDDNFFVLATHTLMLALTTALIAAALALFLAYGRRTLGSPVVNASVRVAGMGYAIPGTVIAVGVLLPLAWFDNTLDSFARASFGVSTGLLLSGTWFALVFAYLARFLAVSLNTTDAGLAKVSSTMDDTARTLGCAPMEVVGRVHVPMLRGSLLTAILLVFVDVMKELPATLVLRPFNFNTLAVRAYELASDERLADASTAAIAIVLAGVLPVIFLSIAITRGRRRHSIAEAITPAPLPARG